VAEVVFQHITSRAGGTIAYLFHALVSTVVNLFMTTVMFQNMFEIVSSFELCAAMGKASSAVALELAFIVFCLTVLVLSFLAEGLRRTSRALR